MRPAREQRWPALIAPASAGAFLALQGADATAALAWGVLTLGAAASLFGDRIDWRRRVSFIEGGLLAMLAACVLSIVCSVDARRSVLLSVPVVAAALLWLLGARAAAPEFARRALVAGLAVAALTQASLAVVALCREPHATPADWMLHAGAAWLVVPNDIAWIGCALPLFAALARRPLPVLCGVLLAYLVLCLLLHSRTAAIVAGVGAAWFCIALGARRRASAAVTAVSLAAAAAAVAVFAAGFASLHARAQLWRAAWAMFLDHPLCGVGLHDFVLGYRSYLPPDYEWIDGRLTPWPHSLPLEVAAECGLAGIIASAFVATGLVRWVAARRASREPGVAAVCAALAGLGLLALVEASLLRQWLWFFGTSVCALATLQRGARASHEGNEAHVVDQDPA